MNEVQVFEGDGIAPAHSLTLAEARQLKRGDRVWHSVARDTSFVIAAIEDAIHDRHGRPTQIILWINGGGEGSQKYVVPHGTWLCRERQQ